MTTNTDINTLAQQLRGGATINMSLAMLVPNSETLALCDALEAAQKRIKELEASQQVVPEGYCLVPLKATQAHLNSIAMRYRHDFYLLSENERDSALSVARQMYSECTGQGFYSIPGAPAPQER